MACGYHRSGLHRWRRVAGRRALEEVLLFHVPAARVVDVSHVCGQSCDGCPRGARTGIGPVTSGHGASAPAGTAVPANTTTAAPTSADARQTVTQALFCIGSLLRLVEVNEPPWLAGMTIPTCGSSSERVVEAGRRHAPAPCRGRRALILHQMPGRGGAVMEQRIRTEPERFAAVLGTRPRARIVIEASTDSEWVAPCLEALGHEVIVADPYSEYASPAAEDAASHLDLFEQPAVSTPLLRRAACRAVRPRLWWISPRPAVASSSPVEPRRPV